MKHYRLYEDKRPRKLHVITSQKIDKRIDDIYTYNQDNIVAVRAWLEYIEGFGRLYIKSRHCF